ncbi:hypothetical protein N0V82_002931 [Gnomoniopsis sp. IMI 355080]|nr:hypothetical protein N0V82_002931 [Gnomoniopsis sp. IMI 355080]
MDWDHPLQSATPTVVMLNGYQSPQEETTLTLYCHDHAMKKATAIGDKEKKLFHVEGATFGTSWSWRRKVFDSTSQAHLFDFRHASVSLKNSWVVETGQDGYKGSDGNNSIARQICSIVHNSQITAEHSSVNATVRTQAGEDVLIVMRQKDTAATSAYVQVGDATVAIIYKMVDNFQLPLPKDRDRSVWKARIAPGTDLSMIMMMMLCRAEMGHVWNQ